MFRKFSQWFDPPLAGKASSSVKRRPCGRSGCLEEGAYRAPKSRHHLESGVDDWHWFCLIHVRDYNAQWNYYAHMSEEQIEKERRADMTGQRPSWPLGTSSHFRQSFQDPFGLFHEASPSPTSRQCPFPPQSLESKALAVLGLSYPFSENDLRQRYRTLVKKHHPDANGGSLKAEEAIKRINEAYEALKKVCMY